jgi:hypothetical protein
VAGIANPAASSHETKYPSPRAAGLFRRDSSDPTELIQTNDGCTPHLSPPDCRLRVMAASKFAQSADSGNMGSFYFVTAVLMA